MTFADITGPVLGFVSVHGHWAPVVACLLAFAESLAFVSLIVPATVLLVGIGGLIPLAGLSFWTIAIGAAVGAALGDWVSYAIGHHFQDRIATLWPLNRYPTMLPRAHRFFERWGALGVFFGRFLGPLRATIPLVAGTVAMPQWRFQLANWLSAGVWSLGLLAPGTLGMTGLERVLG